MALLQCLYEFKLVRKRTDIMLPDLTFRNSADIFHAFKNRFDKAYREEFIILLLNGKNRMTGFHVVSIGSATSTLVHPREVYTAAVKASAAAMILLHNHPSGDPLPSAEDLQITQRIREIGELFGIRVLDHIIIGCNRNNSFVDDCYWDKTN